MYWYNDQLNVINKYTDVYSLGDTTEEVAPFEFFLNQEEIPCNH